MTQSKRSGAREGDTNEGQGRYAIVGYGTATGSLRLGHVIQLGARGHRERPFSVANGTVRGGRVQMAEDGCRHGWYDTAIDGAPRIALGCPPAARARCHRLDLTPLPPRLTTRRRTGNDKGKPGVSRGRKATGLGAPSPS